LSLNDNTQLGRRFFDEALPLISTYFSGEGVKLGPTAASLGEDSEDGDKNFIAQIRLRHSIACCYDLVEIVHKIEEGLSTVTETIRTDTKGVINGRLDVPRYVTKRASSFSWPKTYPILITKQTPSTPENALLVRVLRVLHQRLSTLNYPVSSAESAIARQYRNWIVARLKREPWSEIIPTSSLPRLYKEACRRICRGQTGNEYAYHRLVNFLKQWGFVGREFGGVTRSARFIEALLAFPIDQAFADRIYEIWCIRSIADALFSLGAELINGPREMTLAKKYPIYSFKLEEISIEIWFQKSLPNENAEWLYESTTALRGIPDITVFADKSHRLLVDAKNRIVKGNTRSEETYKMLGYFENFHNVLNERCNWGVLTFISTTTFTRSLFSRNQRRLELISAHAVSAEDCNFAENMARILAEWVSEIKSNT
jgi:hypothetical protein